MNEKIQIFKHVFNLKKAHDSNTVISCDFTVEGKLPKEMTEFEVKTGHKLQQEIFSGKWDWLIFNRGLIRISEFNIEISLCDPIYAGPTS